MTREKLIKLINRAYNDGYNDAQCNHINDCENYGNEIDYINPEDIEITRLEVINHNKKNGLAFGRILTLYKVLEEFDSIELSYQDGRKTLKIFLD